ncbi:transposase [Nostoc sp. FACHB-133]|uniref:transposase n=1 Tax=unclassified Nostoc TaxID=2593658 RepID=UPI001683DF93|nr:transposase [Nostoc sp. FACHB-133]MBD2525514.1 transposase [Nostoc sp. FACHB-133]
MNESQTWYIVKHSAGNCEIVPSDKIGDDNLEIKETIEQWGPFSSQGEAIARRVGLIRAGKCQPV